MSDSELQDSFNLLAADLKTWKNDLDCNFNKLNERFTIMHTEISDIKSSMSEIKKDISAIKIEQENMDKRLSKVENYQSLHSENISDVKVTCEFLSQQHITLSTRVSDIEHDVKACDQNYILISSLENKIDTLEQHARQCNVEITNLPERRNENLISLILNIGKVIKCSVTQSDIIAIHRVPHAHPGCTRPKNIVIKFISRILRDNFLSSFRLAKNITTAQLDIQGSPQSIFINEHLTLKNKMLFRECRETAKRHGYKYVWVRHATILVRESDTSPIFAIKSQNDISRIKPRNQSGARMSQP
ncbi:hypothetical protein K1T71_009816 [Dendrolimus kikuchii]|uniref:Uncharacterized protein n=1 Tax=Dendrolimus kikuchii TaxID=765133 RepID=A0ACC1CSU4_9NEOP|nr:hypothetical protein K1T71_009816 [Dendrolimus kikuchii]